MYVFFDNTFGFLGQRKYSNIDADNVDGQMTTINNDDADAYSANDFDINIDRNDHFDFYLKKDDIYGDSNIDDVLDKFAKSSILFDEFRLNI